MALYRKNIGSLHQVIRIGFGLGLALWGLAGPSGLPAAGVIGSGLILALTGAFGWCPACAVAGGRKGQRS